MSMSALWRQERKQFTISSEPCATWKTHISNGRMGRFSHENKGVLLAFFAKKLTS